MEIVDHCTDSHWSLVGRVRRGLQFVPPPDLNGISFIHLRDCLPPKPNMLPKSANDAAAKGLSVYGWYSRQYKNRAAAISLHITDILRGVPGFYWLTPVPTILITLTLAHEVGHHLVAKRGYIFKKGDVYKRRFDVEQLCVR